MSKPDRSCVMRLAEGQARIPGPAGERDLMLIVPVISGLTILFIKLCAPDHVDLGLKRNQHQA